VGCRTMPICRTATAIPCMANPTTTAAITGAEKPTPNLFEWLRLPGA
jgi:hypothetical protein